MLFRKSQIIRNIGKQQLLIQCIEECAELIQALTKELRQGTQNRSNKTEAEIEANICEEIADVENLLAMTKRMYNKRMILQIRSKKIKRWVKRIND